MKISRDNPTFDNYDVFITVGVLEPKTFLGYAILRGSKVFREVKLTNVVEADDESGFLVQHLTDDKGNLIYTNSHDEISVDNTVKFLMCNPQLRSAFLASGFRPKLTSRYEKSLRIVGRVGEVITHSEAREELSFPSERVQFDAI